MPYSRCGRTFAPYNWMKANFERYWKERRIMVINRLALFAVSAVRDFLSTPIDS